MDQRSRIAEQLRGKLVYASDGFPVGKAMLLAECGRVMAMEDITDMSPQLLQLVDTVCVNRDDPLNPKSSAPVEAGDAAGEDEA